MALKATLVGVLLAGVALVGGFFIGYADSHSDDVFVTLGVLVAFSFLLGLLGPRWPWLWAVLIGIWVPVLDATLPRVGLAPQRPGESLGFLSLLAVSGLVMTVCGAGTYAGALLVRAARREKT